MIYKDNLIKHLVIFCLLLLYLAFVACKTTEYVETTQTAQTTITALTTRTSTPPATATVVQPLPLVPPTTAVTLPPTVVKTSTSAPPATISPMQKIGVLPISGSVLAISSDGTLLASADVHTDILYIFDMTEQITKWELMEDSGGMTGYSSLDFSPDGNLLAAGGVEQDVFVWDMFSGELVYQIHEPYYAVKRVSFSPDGQLLAVSSEETYSVNAGVMIYSMVTGGLVDTFPSPNIVTYPSTDGSEHFLKTFQDFGWFVGEAVFVPNHSNLLAITINDPLAEAKDETWALYLWDMEGQQLQGVLPGAFGDVIAVSPNGHLLAASVDDQLYSWDVQNNTELFVRRIENLNTYRMALSNTGFLARLNWSGVTTIWNQEGDLLMMLEPTGQIATDIVFTPDDHFLIAYIGDKSIPIEIWGINK